MNRFLLASTGLLAACAGTSRLSERSNGVFVQSGTGQFAVFTQGEDATALFVGTSYVPDRNWIIPAAKTAIEQVTGCPVVQGSVEAGDKSVAVRVDCSRRTSVFLRKLDQQRGNAGHIRLENEQKQRLLLSETPTN